MFSMQCHIVFASLVVALARQVQLNKTAEVEVGAANESGQFPRPEENHSLTSLSATSNNMLNESASKNSTSAQSTATVATDKSKADAAGHVNAAKATEKAHKEHKENKAHKGKKDLKQKKHEKLDKQEVDGAGKEAKDKAGEVATKVEKKVETAVTEASHAVSSIFSKLSGWFGADTAQTEEESLKTKHTKKHAESSKDGKKHADKHADLLAETAKVQKKAECQDSCYHAEFKSVAWLVKGGKEGKSKCKWAKCSLCKECQPAKKSTDLKKEKDSILKRAAALKQHVSLKDGERSHGKHSLIKRSEEDEDMELMRQQAKTESHLREIVFQPGSLGLGAEWETGSVKVLLEGAQAQNEGVKVGWKLKTINGRMYSEKFLDEKIKGTEPYVVEFEKPADVAAEKPLVMGLLSEGKPHEDPIKLPTTRSVLTKPAMILSKVGKHLSALKQRLDEEQSAGHKLILREKEKLDKNLHQQQMNTSAMGSAIKKLSKQIEGLTIENSELRKQAIKLQKNSMVAREEISVLQSNLTAMADFVDDSMVLPENHTQIVSVLRELEEKEAKERSVKAHEKTLSKVGPTNELSLLQFDDGLAPQHQLQFNVLGNEAASTLEYINTIREKFEGLHSEMNSTEAELVENYTAILNNETATQVSMLQMKSELEMKKEAAEVLKAQLKEAVIHLDKTESFLGKKLQSLKTYAKKLGKMPHVSLLSENKHSVVEHATKKHASKKH